MRIFVIGGTGFVGLPVTRRFATAGHSVTVFHRGRTTPNLPSSVSSVHGSRDDRATLGDALNETAPDVIVDMVAYTEEQAASVADLAAHNAKRLVAISSGDVYRQYDGLRGQSDVPPDPVPLSEDTPLRSSRYPYRGSGVDFRYAKDYDKILVEQQVRAGAAPSTILRLPKVYGPRDAQHHVGEAMGLIRDSNGKVDLGEKQAEWRWSRGYVENVAAAIVQAATDERAAGRTYNLGEPDGLPEATWLRHVAAAAGHELTIETRPDDQVREAPPFDWSYDMALDTRRIRTELDFTEPVPREQAMSRSLTWEQEQGAST